MINNVMSYQGCHQVNKATGLSEADRLALEKTMADVELYSLEAKCDALRHKFDAVPTSSPALKNAIGAEFQKAYTECARAKQAFVAKYESNKA